MTPTQIIIYVEGVSDKNVLSVLLNPLIEQKQQKGIAIAFFEATEGDRKKFVVEKAPVRAVNILSNQQDALVVAMPDLYPKNKGFPHNTAQELANGIQKNFENALKNKGITDERLNERFKVFCFKYELEVLLLAAEDALKAYLGVETFAVKWKKPVEDQNHDKPPKQVIEELFQKSQRTYKEADDAARILSGVNYQDIAAACPQCFAPFVAFLESL